jgi:hypothetical protein
LAVCLLGPAARADEPPAIDIGSRRELFVDEALIARREGVELRLHHATPREIVLDHDAPWEGSGTSYHTIFRDGPILRMYYVAGELTNADGTEMSSRPLYACYAESRDGIHWDKPELGLFEFDGSKKNNIVWAAENLDNFTPFKDPNPDRAPDEPYKSVSSGPGGLFAYKSSDGVHWSRLVDRPILTKGAFDTQNNAFWDPVKKHYWCYIRDFHDGVRDIRVSTSPDFRDWTEPEPIAFVDGLDEALYTSQVRPYDRAPHIFLGFPARYVEREWSPSFDALPDVEHRKNRMRFSPRFGTALTDCLFMSSRDGRTFRRWDEAFMRPGPEGRDNWVYGDGYVGIGLIELPAEDPDASPELSLYAPEGHWKRRERLRRHTIRVDGFASLHARREPGEAVTKPIVFVGDELTLNFSTSAAGSVRVELQTADGAPIPGFALDDADDLFGDSLDRVASWKKGQTDVGRIAGQPIRLRLVLSDADVYSFQFRLK